MRWKTPQKEVNVEDQRLLAACRQGDLDMLHDALNNGAKPDCTEDSGWMPLHLACAHRHEDLVEALLTAGANPDLLAKVNGLSPLSVAIRTYYDDNPGLFADPNEEMMQPTKAEQEEEHVMLRISETLLRFGADPSGCEDIRIPSSPLHVAARNGHLELIKLLVEYGALMIHGQPRSTFHPLSANGSNKSGTKSGKPWVSPTAEPAAVDEPASPNTTLTPLGVACQVGQVNVMDYFLGILPPQTLETSFVLQQALQEARRNHQVDCLVGLWEYSEEVLWLDCERFADGLDPARKNGLVQTFFDVFTETGKRDESGHPSLEEEADEEDFDDGIMTQLSDDSNAENGVPWLEILQEACRRRSVNLLQPLLLRLPNPDEFFEHLQKDHGVISATLIQAVDRRDHQTLLHRFCAGEEVHESTTANDGTTNPPQPPPTLSLAARSWIRRLLKLSRESDEIDLEEIRLAELAATDGEDLNASKYVALYQSDSKFHLDSSAIEDSETNTDRQEQQKQQQRQQEDDQKQQSSSDEDDSSEVDSSDYSGSDDEEESDDSDDSIDEEEDDEDSLDLEEEFASGDLSRSDESVETTQRSHVPRRGAGVPDLLRRRSGGTGDSESEESFSFDSATCSESDDGFRSQASSENSPEDLHGSFLALPSHSGKDLVNAGDIHMQTPLHVACARGVVAAVEILLEEENIQVNATDAYGNTPFLLSMHPAVVTCLLQDKRTDVNATNEEGNTRLHRAIQQDDMPIFQLLLANGADLEITDKNGRTPLYFACAEGSLEICGFLLAHGADPNTTTNDQQDTPMHAACRGGHLGPLLRLFSAQVETQDVEGDTPLHLACLAGHVNIVDYLVNELGASLNVQNKKGLTPFETACLAGSADVIYYIVRFHSLHLWKRETRVLSVTLPPLSARRHSSSSSSSSSTASCDISTNRGLPLDTDLVSLYETAIMSYREDPFQYSKVFDPSLYRGETLSSLPSFEVPSYESPASSSFYDSAVPYANADAPSSYRAQDYEPEENSFSSRYRRSLYDDEPICY